MYRSVLVLFLVTHLFSLEPKVLPDTYHFKKASLFISAGGIAPLGDLSGVLDGAPYFGVGFRPSYSEQSDIVLTLEGMSLDALQKPVSVWLVRGRAGFSYYLPLQARIGTGLTLSFIRSKSNDGEPLMLDDNESDFGFYASVQTPALLYNRWSFALDIVGDLLFTEPEYSYLGSVSLVVGYEIW